MAPAAESSRPPRLTDISAACQIGITLSSLVLGAFAQRTIALELAPLFGRFGGLQEVAAQSTSAVVVLLLLTVAQVIFSELVPKSLALQYPTQAALYTLLANGAVTVAVPALHPLAERIRPLFAQARRIAVTDTRPHPFTR